MEAKSNGQRYNIYKVWDKKLHQPYDYENNGLMSKLLSYKIWSTKNKILRFVIRYIEQSLIFCMKSADQLANFFNYNKNNR